jgi:hypothetical protein
VQGPTNLLFAVWFGYDPSGKPTWYTLQSGEWTFGYEADFDFVNDW